MVWDIGSILSSIRVGPGQKGSRPGSCKEKAGMRALNLKALA